MVCEGKLSAAGIRSDSEDWDALVHVFHLITKSESESEAQRFSIPIPISGFGVNANANVLGRRP
jgi:hypothetical protein